LHADSYFPVVQFIDWTALKAKILVPDFSHRALGQQNS
jgi:hypothetical protein